jgi:uncharacterized protein
MDENSTRQCILNFLDGYFTGNAAQVEQCCDDQFSSIAHAPIEIFPHHGLKQGKGWVAEAIRIQRERYSARRYKIRHLITHGPQAAAVTDITLTKRNDHRVIQFAQSEFFTLHNGRIREHHAFFDSLDLLQQLLGRDLSDPFAYDLKTAMQS